MKMKLIFWLVILSSACNKNKESDNSAPKLTIEDLQQSEGNGGSTAFEFVFKLDIPSSKEVTVQYTTAEGTAKNGEDFTATSGMVKFLAGEKEKKIVVSVTADDLKEGDDEFSINLSAATNATITKVAAKAVIANDDSTVPVSNAGYDAPTGYAGYTLAWSDEFNGPALNSTIWTNQNGDGCPQLCGWGNNELEFYTDRPDNLFFQDGKLIVEAKKEAYGGKQYTSSKILTSGKKAFKFGRIDIRAQLPKGKGIWPAFWLLPQDNVYGGWPRSGEIDLMELVGHEPGKTYGTLHFGPGPGSTQISRNYTLPAGESFNDKFHVFSLEWKQDQIKWFIDGNLYSTVNKSDLGTVNYPFNENFFLIFNLAVGGNWPGNPDATTYFPQWLIVDYIRVYQ
jgi:beta-glucanase (GH16 family)